MQKQEGSPCLPRRWRSVIPSEFQALPTANRYVIFIRLCTEDIPSSTGWDCRSADIQYSFEVVCIVLQPSLKVLRLHAPEVTKQLELLSYGQNGSCSVSHHDRKPNPRVWVLWPGNSPKTLCTVGLFVSDESRIICVLLALFSWNK